MTDLLDKAEAVHQICQDFITTIAYRCLVRYQLGSYLLNWRRWKIWGWVKVRKVVGCFENGLIDLAW